MPKKIPPRKNVHYVQLRTYRQWPNPLTYKSCLEASHSKFQPITSDIDRRLNTKWIDIRRPEILAQLNENHRNDIQKKFLHQTNLIDYKYFCLRNQLNEDDQFLREIFLRFIEISHSLLDSYEQIKQNERHIYEDRLTILKEEFESAQDALKHLFLDQEFKELDNQINVLNALEEEDILQQSIQFKLQQRQLQEDFVKDIAILRTDFQRQTTFLKSILNKVIYPNEEKMKSISKDYHYLHEKTHRTKERIGQEMTSNEILKRKIKETKQSINEIETTENHLYDKINQVKQCVSEPHHSTSNSSQILFRRLCVLADHVQRACRNKLQKAERIFLLIRQCHRLELTDESLLLTNSKDDGNAVLFLQNCHLELDFSLEELSSLWKRFAHVQMDLYIRLEEKSFLQKYQKFLQKQLKNVL